MSKPFKYEINGIEFESSRPLTDAEMRFLIDQPGAFIYDAPPPNNDDFTFGAWFLPSALPKSEPPKGILTREEMSWLHNDGHGFKKQFPK